MKKYLFLIIHLLLSYCAVGPTHGSLVTVTSFPGEFNLMNNVKSEKKAQGCIHSLLAGLGSWGDAGAGSIAYKKGITKIATIDHSTISIFSIWFFHLYKNYCTVITGE